ncbi:MAG: LPS export ABC transporter periplasmic protein LptC [Xanthobacteraceae bacterium]|nr:LPS export ABC transporter periplasmic protein LptC [Xanthobacteraceae bacterium]
MTRPITADPPAGHDTHAWTVSRRADIGRAFRRARRHSRRVRILRLAIPLAVLVGTLVIVLMTWFNPLRVLANLPTASGGKLAVSGSKITMELPRLAGFTKDSRSYEVSAKSAIQDLAKPDQVELREIQARMGFQDQSTVEMRAVSGTYNTKREQLVLSERITLTSSKGYAGHLSEAAVDMRKGSITSERPVRITMPSGVLESNRLQVLESGDLIRFDGGVVLHLEGGAVAGATPGVGGEERRP